MDFDRIINLIADSAVFKNIFQRLINRGGGDKHIMWVPLGVLFLVWKLVICRVSEIYAVYGLSPVSGLSCLAIVVVFLLMPAPFTEICADFEQAKSKVEVVK